MDNTLNNISNKFTGKERDQETGYDYFGARYYDSRIGRWLQTEPLYEKYLQYSTYQYALLNPMKLVDADGNDVIVTIDGNVITVTVNIYYSSNENSPGNFSDPENLAVLNEYINEAKNDWQAAADQYNNEGHEYQVNINIQLISKIKLYKKNKIPKGENIAYYDDNIGDAPEVINGNRLYIVTLKWQLENGDYQILKTPPRTGTHEIGHIMGYQHIGEENSVEQLESKNIMGYNDKRETPTSDDISNLVNRIKKNKKKQILRGDLCK